MQWAARINNALEESRFELFRMTILPLQAEDAGEHFELLLRMRDESGKIVAPDQLIAAAERYGITPSIDRWRTPVHDPALHSATTERPFIHTIRSRGRGVLVALVPSDLVQQMTGGVHVDWPLVAFTAVVALGCGALFGLAPAVYAARGHVHTSLKAGGRGGSDQSRAGVRMRNTLVVAEMSLALVLLVGAGLMVRSLAALQQVNLGFRAEEVLTARTSLPSQNYRNDTAFTAFFDQAEAQIAAAPGVDAVGTISYLPLTGLRSVNRFSVEGRPRRNRGESSEVTCAPSQQDTSARCQSH